MCKGKESIVSHNDLPVLFKLKLINPYPANVENMASS